MVKEYFGQALEAEEKSNVGDLEDYVAAKLIVTEAGGKVTDFAGAPELGRSPNFVATNGRIVHEVLLEIVR